MIHESYNPRDWVVRIPNRQPKDWEGSKIIVPKKEVRFLDKLLDALRAWEGK